MTKTKDRRNILFALEIVKKRIAELRMEEQDVTTNLHSGSMDYYARIEECKEIMDRLRECQSEEDYKKEEER